MTILFVWDFHGVLEKDCYLAALEVTRQVLKEFKRPADFSDEHFKRLYGIKWVDIFKIFSPDSSEKEIEDMNKRAYEIANTGVWKKYIKQMDNAPLVLDEINKKGGINIILSNTEPNAITKFTEFLEIKDFFKDHIGVDDFEKNQITSKSQAIKEYLEKNNFSKVIVIGDHPEDIQEGKKANAVTYLFSHDENFPDIEADYKISDLREVLKEI